MLRVSLLGNLGADPEQRFTQKGAAMTTFRVAVNQVQTGPDGERQERTEWFRIRTMGRLAETATRLTKGSRVFVAGRLDIQHYQSREGEPRVGFDVWADEVVNLTSRAPGMDGAEEADAPAEAVPARAPVMAGAGSRGASPRGATSAPQDLDDLPF